MRCWQTGACATDMGVVPASSWICSEEEDVFLQPLNLDDPIVCAISAIGRGIDKFWEELQRRDRMWFAVFETMGVLRRTLKRIRGGPPDKN